MSRSSKRTFALSDKKRALLEALLQEEGITSSLAQKIPRRKDAESYLLSFAQQRLWFLNQLEPNSPFYNTPAAIRLVGGLSLAALEQSLNEIVRRHEALRTSFTSVDGRPKQVIAPSLSVTLPLLDLRELPESEREMEARRVIGDEARRPFDLEHEPLFRASLLRLAEDEHVLFINMHHIVSDGWSFGVLFRELTALYQALSKGVPSQLPELPIQYADYAAWQREWLRGETLEKQLSYWRQRLGGELPVLELPGDRPRPAQQTFRGGERQFVILPQSLSEALEALSRQEGATLFMTLLAAFKTLLSRYTNQEDIITGSPIANRNRAEIEGLIGFFINTLVLRTDLSGNPTFRELLSRVRETTLGAYEHQDVPFEKLVEELRPERNLSHAPLFQVMFALQNTPGKAPELEGLKVHPLRIDQGTSKFDLTLSIWVEGEGLRATVAYNTDLFDASTIKRMLGHFQTLLEAVVANPDQRLSALPLLTSAERRQLLVEWNNTYAEYPADKTVHELFEQQVERTPEAVAVVFEQEQLTYAELNARANQLAHYLRRLGVGPEVLVGICVERSLEMVVGVLGVLKAGGAYVPLDPTYPKQRLAFIQADSRVVVMLTQQCLLDELPEQAGAELICLDSGWDVIAKESRQDPVGGATAESLAYVIYTSGSTGKPKGVMIEHRGICNYLFWMQDTYPLAEADRVLQTVPFSFDVSVRELFWPLSSGAGVVLVPQMAHRDSSYLVEVIARHGITDIRFSPSMLQVFLDEPGVEALRSLKRVFCGGEAMPVELQQRFFARLPADLHNTYGPTEASVNATAWACKRGELQPIVPIGRPIANTQVYILDTHLQPVPIGVAGELHIGGSGLARGYLSRPELTAEKFIANPISREPGARLYKTGDLARYLPEGNLEFLGRIDDQVKIRGFRIELGEVEAVLSTHAGVRETVVTVREDVMGDKRLVAYFVAQQPAPTIDELRNVLKEKLPEYMVPGVFVRLDALPMTPNGKVDRRGLPAPDQAKPELEGTYIAPRNSVEEVVAGIWAEVLKLERVGIHDNFFELGGHSLLAIRVISRVRAALQVELPLRALFEEPSVAGLAERVGDARQTNVCALIVPLRPVARDGAIPLSFAQQRLWFLDQLEPNSAFYNMPMALRLSGHLNIEALEQALATIVTRHESLRTTFATVDGSPVQVIAPAQSVALPVIDLSNLSASDGEAEGQRLATEEKQRPFDLARGPLLRASLLRLGEEEHVLLLNIHHIVSDGWSMGVLFRELGTLYQAFSTGKPSPLPELPIQYADYAVWQREWLQGEVLEEQLSYWRKQLAGAPAVLELPTDRPRPAVQSYRGARHPLRLSKEVTERLKALTQQEGATLFVTMLAAFQTLLMRYTGQEDIVVGSAIAGRARAEVEGLIGFFVNTLVLRTDLSGGPSFRELVGRVREVTLGAYEHQDVPFEKLVEELQPERSLSHTPLFQVMFTLQNAPKTSLELSGLTLGSMSFDSQMPVRSDIDFYLWEASGEIVGHFVYNTDLFEAATIARMRERFEVLVESIVRAPDAALADLKVDGGIELPMIPAVVKQQVEEQRAAPLSYHQERLWFIDQFETGNVYETSPVYHNIPLILQLSGPVDSGVLEASLNVVIARHAALRTRVVTEGGQGLQVVSPRERLQLKVVDLADSGERVSVAGAVERGLAEARQPFELGRDLLIRGTLFRLSEEEAVLAVSVHHIVADKESLRLLVEEVGEVYGARTAGRAAQLPELGLQYADYTEWQRGLSAEELDGLLFYWRWQLRGKLAALELPEDRARPAVHTYSAARLSFWLPEGLGRRLQAMSEAAGTDLFAVVLAGFKALLHRYARQDEIVVGTSEACRERRETQAVVGPFANLVVLRSDLSGNPRFRDLIVQIGKTVGQARAHREMPFDKLVQELKPEKDMSRTALFDVLFELSESETTKLQMGGVEARVVETNLGYGKYDLNLSIRGGGAGLSATVVYNADIFEAATVAQMMRHFEVLLEAVAADPERRIDDITLLSEAEEHQQLAEWNATGARYPEDKTIHQLFEEQVERTPHHTAVVYGEEQLTYRELDGRANQLARHLQQLGVGPDTLVALCLDRSAEMVVALLAVLKAGGAYLPLDPAYPQERLTFMVEDSGVSHLITTAALQPNIRAQVPALILLDRDGESIAAQAVAAPSAKASRDNLAYVIYTSGSTGKPKGVLLEHGNVVRLLVNDRLPFLFTADDVWTMFHSYCFDFSVWEMYGALLYGGKLVVVPEQEAKDPALFLELLREHRVTVLNQTPSAFDSLVRQALAGAEPEVTHSDLALRYVIFGGEALHPVQLREWKQAYPAAKLINMYGITETTVHVTFKEIREREIAENVSNIGRPIPTTTTYIMDENLRLLPVGVPGEVCVGGGGVSRGYLGREELTRVKFVSNPYKAEERVYRSGDLAKLLPSGELVYLGRMDDQVQIRGFRVELGEVRSRLLEHPLVAEAEVIARKVRGEAVELVAYVAAADVSVTALREHLGRALPYYMVPTAFVLLEKLPLTANGKVDRRALPEPDESRPELETRYVAPRTAVEEVLVGIWQEVLGVERVGVADNFFELGGHSLLATQVVSRLREALQVEVPLRTLFEQLTVAGLASAVTQRQGESKANGISPIKRAHRGNADQALATLDQLSDDEVNSLLSNVLAGKELNG